MSSQTHWQAQNAFAQESFAKAKMRVENRQPDKEHPGDSRSIQHEKSVLRCKNGQQDGSNNSCRRSQESAMWDSVATDLAHPARGVTSLPQGEEHSCGQIEVRSHAGECSGQDDEIHDRGSKWNMRCDESVDKGAAGNCGQVGG